MDIEKAAKEEGITAKNGFVNISCTWGLKKRAEFM